MKGIVPSRAPCLPPLHTAVWGSTKKGIVRPKGGPCGLGLLGGSGPPRLCFLSFLLSALSFFVLSTAQADGSGKEQAGEADIAGVFSEMESFRARTPSGSLRLAGLWL